MGGSLAIASLFWLPATAIAAYFQGLGGLSDVGSLYSRAWDLSADGLVVIGESRSKKGIEAFRWTAASGMVGLSDLGGEPFRSTALGISADGLVVVGASRSPMSGFDVEAFRWTAAAGMVGLGDLSGGEYSSGAAGASADGSVVVGSSMSELSPTWGEAFRWTEATGLVGLGVLSGSDIPTSVPRRVSADGSVVIGWGSSKNGREAFRWTEGEGMVGLGDLPGPIFDSLAMDISADGSVIVGLAHGSSPTSFRWTEAGGMVDLGRPAGALDSQAWGVSADGSVAVGDAAFPGEIDPAIWDATNGMRNLVDVLVEIGLGPQIEGWDLELATAISDDGLTVVGWGYNPDGDEEAWIAYLGQPSLVEIPTVSDKALISLAALLAVTALATLRLRANLFH